MKGDINTITNMTIPANRLFSAASLKSLLIAIEIKIQKIIEIMEASLITNNSIEEIAKSLETQYRLTLPVLNREDVHISDTDDCKISVQNDFSRSVSDRSKPCLVDGKKIVVNVPFVGDAKLLMQNPNAPNAISASATVEVDKINLIYVRPLPFDKQLLERDIQNDISAIEANLTFVNADVDSFNRNLVHSILQKLSARKSAIEVGKNALDGLSLPIRIKEKAIQNESLDRINPKPLQQSAMKTNDISRKYDVFICHASEDKETVVTQLANELQKRGIIIWYDQFTLKIGDSLRQKIDEGLKNSRYGIVILSPDFFKKPWTQRELDGLTQKEMRDGTKVILPVWHNVTRDEVFNFSPPLADKMSGSTSNMSELLRDLLEVLTENSDTLKSKLPKEESLSQKPISLELSISLDATRSQLISPQWIFQVEVWITNHQKNKLSDYKLNITFPSQLPMENNNTLQELKEQRTRTSRYYKYPQDNVKPKELYPGERIMIGAISCIIGQHNLSLEDEVMALSATIDFMAADISQLHFDFPMLNIRPYDVTKQDLEGLKFMLQNK